MKLSVTWDLSDQEYAVLQRLVATEGAEGETVEDYAGRVGLKGLRGTLATRVLESRIAVRDALVGAFEAADQVAQAASLDPLGWELLPDGSAQPKDVKP